MRSYEEVESKFSKSTSCSHALFSPLPEEYNNNANVSADGPNQLSNFLS